MEYKTKTRLWIYILAPMLLIMTMPIWLPWYILDPVYRMTLKAIHWLKIKYIQL